MTANREENGIREVKKLATVTEQNEELNLEAAFLGSSKQLFCHIIILGLKDMGHILPLFPYFVYTGF